MGRLLLIQFGIVLLSLSTLSRVSALFSTFLLSTSSLPDLNVRTVLAIHMLLTAHVSIFALLVLISLAEDTVYRVVKAEYGMELIVLFSAHKVSSLILPTINASAH